LVLSRVLWFGIVFCALVWWWCHGGRQDFDAARAKSTVLRDEIFQADLTKGLSFFPASNPKIHVCLSGEQMSLISRSG
jgi:hypothetical protein